MDLSEISFKCEKNKHKTDKLNMEGEPDVCATLTTPEVVVKPTEAKDKPKVHTSMSMEEEVRP